jgi:hypothetical protein
MKTRNLLFVGLVGSGLLAACGAEVPTGAPESIGESSAELAVASARQFDGIDDRITIKNSPKQQFGTGDFTLEASVKLGATARSYEPILSSRTSGTDGFLFVVYGNTLLLQMNGVPNYQSAALPNLRDGKAHHLAVTRAGTTVTFYVDGKPWGSVQSGRSTNSTGPLYIGYDNVDRRSLGGSFGEVRLWNVARSAAAMSEAAKGSSVTGDAAGLVGAYSPNSALSQMVTDRSATQNHGFLGTNAARWDAQEPTWNGTVELELTESSATREPSSAQLRTADLGNPDLAICGELTVNGVFDKFAMSSYSSLEEATFHYFCENEQQNLKLAVDFAGALKLPIEGVPVELSASNKTDVNWSKVRTYCQQDASYMKKVDAVSWLSSTASPVLVDGFNKCVDRVLQSSTPSVLVGSQTVSTDGNTLVFNLLAKILANGQPDTIVVDTYATGATCTGALTQTGTVVPPAQPASAICTRVGSGPVSFVVVTTQGTYMFNAGGSGVTGTAWVTGAKQVVTEYKAQKCTDLSVGSRTCLFGACSDTFVSNSINVDHPYTAFRNASLVTTSTHGNIRNPSWWYANNNRTVFGQFWRTKNHSASMRLCAEQFRTETTYTDFTSPVVNVYGTKNFEVRVDNAYQGKALHVLTTDNNMLLQALDAASYAPPFVLVSKVADPLKTTYLVKIDD